MEQNIAKERAAERGGSGDLQGISTNPAEQ